MLPYLPEFLDGIFNMVSDKKKEIKCAAETTLGEFLSEIESKQSKVDFGSLVKILMPRCSSQGNYHSMSSHSTFPLISGFFFDTQMKVPNNLH